MPAAAIVVMHAFQALLGHDWIAVYGPAVALLIALSGGWLLSRCLSRRAESFALIASTLLLLALLPVWVEGELAGSSDIALRALHGHDLPTVVATMLALYAFAVVSGTRLVIDFLNGHE